MILRIDPPLPCGCVAVPGPHCGQLATQAHLTPVGLGYYTILPICPACAAAMARNYGVGETAPALAPKDEDAMSPPTIEQIHSRVAPEAVPGAFMDLLIQCYESGFARGAESHPGAVPNAGLSPEEVRALLAVVRTRWEALTYESPSRHWEDLEEQP